MYLSSEQTPEIFFLYCRKRSTAAQCLQHPWLNQITQPNNNDQSEQQIAGKQVFNSLKKLKLAQY